MKNGYLTLLCGLFVFVLQVVAENADDVARLNKELFLDYDNLIRPVVNRSQAVHVDIEIYILYIHALDMKLEVLQSNGWFRIIWRDEFLTWNRTEYGGLERILVPQSRIWTPDFMFPNTISNDRTMGKVKTSVSVRYDGSVQWMPEFNMGTTCKIDITRYPMDTQTCRIQIASWTMFCDELTILSHAPDMSSSTPNGQFDVTSTDSINRELLTDLFDQRKKYTVVNFTFKLKRKVTYHLLSLELPVVMMSLLSIISFVVPVDSGEKVTVAMTILLSFTVFLVVIGGSLPETSDNVSLLVVYITIQMGISFMTVTGNTIVLRIHNHPEDIEVPKLLQYVVPEAQNKDRDSSKRCNCCQKNRRLQHKDGPVQVSETAEPCMLDDATVGCNGLLAKNVSGRQVNPWHIVAAKINTHFLCVTSCSSVIVLFVMMLMMFFF